MRFRPTKPRPADPAFDAPVESALLAPDNSASRFEPILRLGWGGRLAVTAVLVISALGFAGHHPRILQLPARVIDRVQSRIFGRLHSR